jgi:hypothetical protein
MSSMMGPSDIRYVYFENDKGADQVELVAIDK